MLECEASYLPFESLFKNFASDITIYNTPRLREPTVLQCFGRYCLSHSLDHLINCVVIYAYIMMRNV